MNGTTIQGLPQKSFRVKSRNPAVKSRVMPRDPSASLRMTVLIGEDSQ
jgi:hypothetical protein